MKVSFKQSYLYNYFIIETQKSLYELRKSHAAFVNRPMSSQPGNMPRRNINSAIPRQQQMAFGGFMMPGDKAEDSTTILEIDEF